MLASFGRFMTTKSFAFMPNSVLQPRGNALIEIKTRGPSCNNLVRLLGDSMRVKAARHAFGFRRKGATGMSTLSGKPDPVVLRIAMADVGEAFSRGLRDFQALLPRDIALALIYVII